MTEKKKAKARTPAPAYQTIVFFFICIGTPHHMGGHYSFMGRLLLGKYTPCFSDIFWADSVLRFAILGD